MDLELAGIFFQKENTVQGNASASTSGLTTPPGKSKVNTNAGC
jgi:hypothetical protein